MRLPKQAPDVTDHVIVFRYGPAVATLLEELKRAGWQAVLVEQEQPKARRLIERGHTVVYGTLEDGVLERAGMARAKTLIANGNDDENAAVILEARQMGFTGEALALVEDRCTVNR